jgi:hypothetical protein
MGLIIKDKLPMFIVGFPTVSDKYNVTGGLLSGTSPVKFGELVMFDGSGYFKKVASASAVSEIAGFVLGTNVKVAEGFATNVVQVNPGEAFNLTLPGSYLAVEFEHVGESAVAIAPRSKVYVDLADGTLHDGDDSAAYVELPGVEFTGAWEEQGSKLVAEIYVK